MKKIIIKLTGLLFILGFAIYNFAVNKFSWQEEVLLHDGTKVIVERENIYDIRLPHELTQPAPLAEQILRFKIPGTNESVTWKSSNRSFEKPEKLSLLSLDFMNNTPYLAATTSFCIAYNRWGRPNPAYIFFKYTGEWQRISMKEFPEQFKVNLIFHTSKPDKDKIAADTEKYGFLRAETVAVINNESGSEKNYYSIIRTPFPVNNMSIVGCEKMIFYKCGSLL